MNNAYCSKYSLAVKKTVVSKIIVDLEKDIPGAVIKEYACMHEVL